MSLNITSTWLEARQTPMILPFSKRLDSSSAWLPGPGGLGGEGFPMPHAGFIRGVKIFDGYSLQEDKGSIAFSEGDRIAVYATYLGGSLFKVAVVLNATPTTIAVESVSASADVFATVDLLLLEDA